MYSHYPALHLEQTTQAAPSTAPTPSNTQCTNTTATTATAASDTVMNTAPITSEKFDQVAK